MDEHEVITKGDGSVGERQNESSLPIQESSGSNMKQTITQSDDITDTLDSSITNTPQPIPYSEKTKSFEDKDIETNQQTTNDIVNAEPLVCPYCHQDLVHKIFSDGSIVYMHKLPNLSCNRTYGSLAEIEEAKETIRKQKAWERDKDGIFDHIYCPICEHTLIPKCGSDGITTYYSHRHGEGCGAVFPNLRSVVNMKQHINRQIRNKIREYLLWANNYRSSPKNDHDLVCPYCKNPMVIMQDENENCFIVHKSWNIDSVEISKDLNSFLAMNSCQAIFKDITDLKQVEEIRRKLHDVSLLPLCPLCGEPLEARVKNGNIEFHHAPEQSQCNAVYKGNMLSVEQARLSLMEMDMEVDPKPEQPEKNIPDFPDELDHCLKELIQCEVPAESTFHMDDHKENESKYKDEEKTVLNFSDMDSRDEMRDDINVDIDVMSHNDTNKDIEPTDKHQCHWFTKLFSFHTKK